MLLPVVLDGPPAHLMGTAEIEQLQKALKNLAVATNRPAIDPGAVTGVMNDSTMVALDAALGMISEGLPSYAYLGIQAALMAGSTTSYAKNLVAQYASQLTVAINTAAVKYKTQPAPVTPTPIVTASNPLSTLFAPGWYKQPWGIALIVIGAFIGYKLLAPAPAAKAKA